MPRDPASATGSPHLLAGLLACGIVLGVNAWPNLQTTVDDAWISGRYALHLAEGYGPVYNAGEPPVEGYTNLLWVVLLAATHRLGLPMQEVMTWAGLLFGVAGLVAAAGLTARLSSRPTPLILLAPLLLALSPHYAIASTNGLETSMYVFAVLGGCWGMLAVRDQEAPHRMGSLVPAALAGLGLGLLGAVRPEGAAIGGLILLFDLVTRRRHLRQPATWAPAAVASGCIAALLLWRQAVYGAWVPNTFDAKASVTLGRLVELNTSYLGHDGWYWWWAGGLLVLAPLLPPWSARRWLTAGLAAFTVAVGFRVHMWMPGARLMVPALALTLCSLVAAVDSWGRWPRRAGGAVLLLLGISPLLMPVHEGVRAYDRRHSVLPDNGAAQAAAHLAAHAPEGAWLAVRDAGVVAFHVGTGVRVAELHQRALTQPHPGGRDTDLGQVVPDNPTFVVLTQARERADGIRYGNDRRVFRRLTEPYVYLGRVYQHHHRYYDLYAREDARIPPLPEHLVVNHAGPAAP